MLIGLRAAVAMAAETTTTTTTSDEKYAKRETKRYQFEQQIEKIRRNR